MQSAVSIRAGSNCSRLGLVFLLDLFLTFASDDQTKITAVDGERFVFLRIVEDRKPKSRTEHDIALGARNQFAAVHGAPQQRVKTKYFAFAVLGPLIEQFPLVVSQAPAARKLQLCVRVGRQMLPIIDSGTA